MTVARKQAVAKIVELILDILMENRSQLGKLEIETKDCYCITIVFLFFGNENKKIKVKKAVEEVKAKFKFYPVSMLFNMEK